MCTLTPDLVNVSAFWTPNRLQLVAFVKLSKNYTCHCEYRSNVGLHATKASSEVDQKGFGGPNGM